MRRAEEGKEPLGGGSVKKVGAEPEPLTGAPLKQSQTNAQATCTKNLIDSLPLCLFK